MPDLDQNQAQQSTGIEHADNADVLNTSSGVPVSPVIEEGDQQTQQTDRVAKFADPNFQVLMDDVNEAMQVGVSRVSDPENPISYKGPISVLQLDPTQDYTNDEIEERKNELIEFAKNLIGEDRPDLRSAASQLLNLAAAEAIDPTNAQAQVNDPPDITTQSQQPESEVQAADQTMPRHSKIVGAIVGIGRAIGSATRAIGYTTEGLLKGGLWFGGIIGGFNLIHAYLTSEAAVTMIGKGMANVALGLGIASPAIPVIAAAVGVATVVRVINRKVKEHHNTHSVARAYTSRSLQKEIAEAKALGLTEESELNQINTGSGED